MSSGVAETVNMDSVPACKNWSMRRTCWSLFFGCQPQSRGVCVNLLHLLASSGTRHTLWSEPGISFSIAPLSKSSVRSRLNGREKKTAAAHKAAQCNHRVAQSWTPPPPLTHTQTQKHKLSLYCRSMMDKLKEFIFFFQESNMTSIWDNVGI